MDAGGHARSPRERARHVGNLACRHSQTARPRREPHPVPEGGPLHRCGLRAEPARQRRRGGLKCMNDRLRSKFPHQFRILTCIGAHIDNHAGGKPLQQPDQKPSLPTDRIIFVVQHTNQRMQSVAVAFAWAPSSRPGSRDQRSQALIHLQIVPAALRHEVLQVQQLAIDPLLQVQQLVIDPLLELEPAGQLWTAVFPATCRADRRSAQAVSS